MIPPGAVHTAGTTKLHVAPHREPSLVQIGWFAAQVCQSYEKPGRWYWNVVDQAAGDGPQSVVESGYSDSSRTAHRESVDALIRALHPELGPRG